MGEKKALLSSCVLCNELIYKLALILINSPLFLCPVRASSDSCMYVGDNELWAAAVFLAREQRRNQPTGTGNSAAQAGQLPPCPLLPHDPLLVLRPQRETQLHRASGQDQVPPKYERKRSRLKKRTSRPR